MSASRLTAKANKANHLPSVELGDLPEISGLETPKKTMTNVDWNRLGLQLRAKGEIEKAIMCYKKALELGPEHAGLWSNVGNAMTELKKFPNAVVSHCRALKLEPENTTYKTNMVWTLLAAGSALKVEKDFRQAINCYREALKLTPKNPVIWAELGRLLLDMAKDGLPKDKKGKPDFARLDGKSEAWKLMDGASRALRIAAKLEPENQKFTVALAGVLNTLGVALRAKRQYRAALAHCREAVGLIPNAASAWSNLGNVLKDMKFIESAIACHKKAIALAPESSDCLFNLEVAYSAGMRTAEALETLEKALALKPNDPDLRWDRALNNLRAGNYAEGWKDYEARLETGALPDRNPPGKPWNGESYAGQKLLIVSEQGYGDTIWASRYLPQVKALGGELIVECRKDMVPLIESMQVADRVIAKGAPFPEVDWNINICSLPRLYANSMEAISGQAYLKAPAERMEKAAAAIGDAKGKLKVGIVWSGSTTFKGNHDRAVPLRYFLDAFALPNVQLYSLQKGPSAAELKALRNPPVIDLAPALDDFAYAAAVVAQLDLVIMTDSAVAHLAGALGKPVWVLLNRAPYWLWLDEREDSPWYGSIQLLRQRVWGDWTGIFDLGAMKLMAMTVPHATGGHNA